MSEALWQMPQECTLIRTDPAPGCGICRSTISKGPLCRETCTTRIVAIVAPFVGRHCRILSQSIRRAEGGHRQALVADLKVKAQDMIPIGCGFFIQRHNQ